MEITLKWNEYKKLWDMWDKDGHFVEEFRDCQNFNNLFMKLIKGKDNVYEVTAAKVTRFGL